MNVRRISWLATMALLTALVAATAPAFPQESGETSEAPVEPAPSSEAVEKILQQQEALLSGQRFAYDPGDRRDPFRSLMEIEVNNRDRTCGDGIACMVIAEIDLGGIVKDANDGDMALFTGSDNKGYFLRVGDSVFDGTVIGIDPRLGLVTFRQEIDDPRRIKPYRDVKKSLQGLDNEESIR
jgi:hypothetical protein